MVFDKSHIQLCKHTECTGCEACRSLCPVGAINMQPVGNLLAEVPIINYDICIKCHACEKVCPVINPLTLNSSSSAIAAIAIDKQINETSTSGGIAAVISNWYIQNNGIVYGVVCEGRDIFHKRCVTKGEITKLKGSKYVKSYLRNTYKEVKEDLKNNKNVVFFGTPCQIAGLKNFLYKDYNNLLTVDLICHGNPSQKLLQQHINSIIGNKNIDRIVFREDGYHMRLYNNNEIIYENNLWESPFNDSYYTAFYIACASFRDSCYHCRYANPSRVGDLTIGDFWGLNKKVKFSRTPNGISVILPNTEKGQNLLKTIDNQIETHIRPLKEAVDGNSQLRSPSTLSFRAKIFRKLFSMGVSLKTALRLAYLPTIPIYFLKSKLR